MLDPNRFSLDAATVGFRRRMKQKVDMGDFALALQQQTDSVKVRREQKETPISEVHVMGAQRFGFEGGGKSNELARQQRQINGYPLRSFTPWDGPVVLPSRLSESSVLSIPISVGLPQYVKYNAAVGNYVSRYPELSSENIFGQGMGYGPNPLQEQSFASRDQRQKIAVAWQEQKAIARQMAMRAPPSGPVELANYAESDYQNNENLGQKRGRAMDDGGDDDVNDINPLGFGDIEDLFGSFASATSARKEPALADWTASQSASQSVIQDLTVKSERSGIQATPQPSARSVDRAMRNVERIGQLVNSPDELIAQGRISLMNAVAGRRESLIEKTPIKSTGGQTPVISANFLPHDYTSPGFAVPMGGPPSATMTPQVQQAGSSKQRGKNKGQTVAVLSQVDAGGDAVPKRDRRPVLPFSPEDFTQKKGGLKKAETKSAEKKMSPMEKALKESSAFQRFAQMRGDDI